MQRILGRVALGAAFSLLAACGSTSQFIAQPRLTVSEPQTDVKQAIAALFGSMSPPYAITLCEAEPASAQCKATSQGVSAKGVGGLVLPLTLHVTGMNIKAQRPTVDGLAVDAAIEARVDSIAPLCGMVGGQILVRANDTASLQFHRFYCNWMAIGNVLVDADFSIDRIDLKEKVMTGFYKLTFHGTGNAAGSGYYRAVIAAQRA